MKKVLLAVLLLSGLAFGQTSVYTHDFSADSNSSTLPTGWSVVAGTMRIQGGQLQCTSGPCIAIYTGATFSSDHYATIKVSGYTSAIGQGLVVREASNSAYYKTACTTASSGTCTAVRLYRVATTLNTFNSGVSIAGSSGTQTLQVVGSTLTVLANGSSIGTSTDATYATGNIGVYFAGTSTANGITWFDAGNMGNPPAATPSISPVTGTYPGIQSVTITDSTSGATICYTTDGSTPTANGAGTCTHGSTYAGSFNVGTVNANVTTTVKAIASKSGNSDSLVATSAITTQYGPAPTISPATPSNPTVFYAQQSITINCAAGSPYYTTNGVDPTTSDTLYAGAFSGTASGTQTIKAVCADSTHAAGPVTSNAYTITPPDFTPSDVTVFNTDFSDVYDANLTLNQVQQLILDYGPTHGKYTAFYPVTGDIGVATLPAGNGIVALSTSTCSTSSGHCVGSSQDIDAAIYTGRTGFDINQFAETKAGGSGSTNAAGPCVRMSGTTAYCAATAVSNTTNVPNVTASIYKVSGSTWTGLASSGPIPFLPGSTQRLRVSQNALQLIIGGSVVASATDTSSPYMTGTCGIGLRGGTVAALTCGNIGTADATTPITLTYPTYTDAPMSTSAWTMGYPWFQAKLPYTVAGGNRWGYPFAALQISGSLYGIGLPAGGAATISYRGGLFGSNHWMRFKVGHEPDDVTIHNWFGVTQHRTFAPGTDGGCAAAGVISGCYDSAGQYTGVEAIRDQVVEAGGSFTCPADPAKLEYACMPYLHATKVTEASSPANNVVTFAGSFTPARQGDELLIIYNAGRHQLACKGNAAKYVRWAANTAYTVGTWRLDSNNAWQRVKTAGTSGSTEPTWYEGWTQATATGETTNDGSVVWESWGYACPTTTMFSWLWDVPEPDMVGKSGIPALWGGTLSSTTSSPIFYDFWAGTATATTACELDANLCTMGAPERVRSWEQY